VKLIRTIARFVLIFCRSSRLPRISSARSPNTIVGITPLIYLVASGCAYCGSHYHSRQSSRRFSSRHKYSLGGSCGSEHARNRIEVLRHEERCTRWRFCSRDTSVEDMRADGDPSRHLGADKRARGSTQNLPGAHGPGVCRSMVFCPRGDRRQYCSIRWGEILVDQLLVRSASAIRNLLFLPGSPKKQAGFYVAVLYTRGSNSEHGEDPIAWRFRTHNRACYACWLEAI
jgi:hypothetical protein